MDDAPEKSEELMLSDWLKREEYVVPSKFVKGLSVRKRADWFLCPNCRSRQDAPKHGVKGGCANGNCDLKWISFGNTLNIWKD